jgi:chromosome segregation ATPase
LANLAQYGTPEDADRMIRQIEEDFETTVAGADSKFNMLQDKPNISSMGLWKVTNDQTALLRAERETTRRVAEINKLRPLLETHVQHKDGIKEQLDHIGDRSRTIESDITAVRNAMSLINLEIEALKKTEAARRAEHDKVAQQRNMMRDTISNLQLDLRAEKAERVPPAQ